MQKSLSFHTFYYFMSLVLMRGSGIIAKILLARSITPYEYGLITLFVISLPGMLQHFTNFCFYDMLGHATEGKKYLGFSLAYGTIVTSLLAIIFFIFHDAIFNFLNVPLDSWWIFYTILFVSLFSVTICGVIVGYLRGARNHSLAATVSAAPSILRVFFILIAVYLFSIDNFYIIIILFALPPLITLIPVIIFKFRTIIGSLKTIVIPSREMVMFGFSYFILGTWIGFSQQINSVVISHDLGLEWQAYFDVSLSIVSVITFFSVAIYLISAPEITYKSSLSEVLNQKGGLGDIGRLFFALCLLCVIILYFYANQLISVIFSSSYAIGANYLYILAMGYAILFIQQYIGFLNIRSDDSGISKLTIVTMAGILTFPLFTHIMIIYFQFLGAYLASAIFIMIYTFLTILLIKDRTPLFLLFKKFDRLLLSVIATFLITYLLHLSLILGIITTLVVFATLIIALGYLKIDVLIFMLHIKRKDI